MSTLGDRLRAAREKKGVTPSAVAAATHIKVQHIEALEGNEFSRMAAPAYARGFIKLYAEYLELDPGPLLEEYTERYAPKEAAPRLSEALSEAEAQQEEEEAGEKRAARWRRLPGILLGPRVLIVVGGVVVVLFVLPPVIRYLKRARPEEALFVLEPERPTALSILREPPEPYLAETASRPAEP